MNIVIITGASSGIGREFALQMDGHFNSIDEFWLVARSRERLSELAEALVHRARIFPVDLTKKSGQEALEEAVKEQKAVVRVLVNCAGYGVMGAFDRQNRDLELGMIRLNCEALTDLTHRMIPHMRPGSRIIQMASSAAFLPQPDFAVYAAAKAYVLSFSRALGEELRRSKIFVTSVCPGPVDTPFFEIAEASGSTLAVKKYTMVTPERVVALALRDSCRKRPMSVCSMPMKTFLLLSRLVPHGVIFQALRMLKGVEK
jgi:hypothetical protein